MTLKLKGKANTNFFVTTFMKIRKIELSNNQNE